MCVVLTYFEIKIFFSILFCPITFNTCLCRLAWKLGCHRLKELWTSLRWVQVMFKSLWRNVVFNWILPFSWYNMSILLCWFWLFVYINCDLWHYINVMSFALSLLELSFLWFWCDSEIWPGEIRLFVRLPWIFCCICLPCFLCKAILFVKWTIYLLKNARSRFISTNFLHLNYVLCVNCWNLLTLRTLLCSEEIISSHWLLWRSLDLFECRCVGFDIPPDKLPWIYAWLVDTPILGLVEQREHSGGFRIRSFQRTLHCCLISQRWVWLLFFLCYQLGRYEF